MDWSEKINNKKYFTGSVLSALFALYAGRASVLAMFMLLGVIVATFLNQWLTFIVLGKYLKTLNGSQIKPDKYQRLVLWGQIALKFSVLGAMFFALITYTRHLAAQGLVLYTFQLIILILSIKNIGAFIKKGSSE